MKDDVQLIPENVTIKISRTMRDLWFSKIVLPRIHLDIVPQPLHGIKKQKASTLIQNIVLIPFWFMKRATLKRFA